mgnify:CR=1
MNGHVSTLFPTEKRLRSLCGEASVASTRRLPGALPAGAPLDNVGTDRELRVGGCAPNIVKDGTPAGGGVGGFPIASTI